MTFRKNSFLILFYLVALFVFYANNVSAASVIYPQKPLNEKTAEPGKDFLRADVFVTLTAKDFKMFTGQKLTLLQKLFLKTVQKRLKKELRSNPDVRVTDYYDPVKKKFKLDAVWFILGIMIGPLALLFAWTSKQNKISKKSVYLALPLFVLWFGYAFLF